MGIFSWLSSRDYADRQGWLRRWVIPAAGRPNRKLDEIKRAAAEDVAEMEKENYKYFRQDGPGDSENDL
jgi:hypothetical protein